MIIITGSVELKPENKSEGVALGRDHSRRSRSEPGCIAHNCYVDAEDENRLHFFEKWESLEAVQTHFKVSESGEFVARMSQLAATPPRIELYRADPIEGAPS